jgi:putative transcriptional regulator
MNILVHSTYRALLKQAARMDADVATRAMLCASPIQVYDHAQREWTEFEGSRDWHDSRKAVDNLIRKLNRGKEWYHPELPAAAQGARAGDTSPCDGGRRGELYKYVRNMYRSSPFSTQNLSLAFSAVKSLTHTNAAAAKLTPAVTLSPPSGFRQGDYCVAPSLPYNAPLDAMDKEDAVKSMAVSDGARLLIAHPLVPGFFRHTVIFLMRFDRYGAFGVVVNRPLTNSDGTVVPVWSALPDEHPLLVKHLSQNPIMIGGPVSTATSIEQSLILLHTHPNVTGAVRLVTPEVGDLCTGGSMDELAALFETGVAKAQDFMCILGYSGWGNEQLEGEIEHGSWFCAQHKKASDSTGYSTSDLLLHTSRIVSGKGLEAVQEPTPSWVGMLHALGPPYAQLGRLQRLSKHLFDDEE